MSNEGIGQPRVIEAILPAAGSPATRQLIVSAGVNFAAPFRFMLTDCWVISGLATAGIAIGTSSGTPNNLAIVPTGGPAAGSVLRIPLAGNALPIVASGAALWGSGPVSSDLRLRLVVQQLP